MSNVAINIAADFTGKKAFANAGKATNSLDKAVGKLGKQLAGVFALTKVVAFGKASVKAFADDEKAVIRLSSSLKNLGLELASPAVNQYIDTLSRATAVADDKLRPAFQALINTTGSLTASQKLLADAVDISAGSGVALETVAQDLASAYVGKTRALGKYNLGLSQAQLKTASFESLMLRLNKQFSGANAAYLDTYAGKMQALGVAGGEAQEKIGGAIIDLATALSGASDIDDLITKIDTLADKIVGMFDAFSEGMAIIRGILNAKTWGGMRDAVQKAQVEEYNRRMRRDYMKVWEGTDIPKSAQQIAAEKKAEAAAKKRAADLLKATTKNTAELKKQAALKKAGTVFDLEQINLIAALKGKLSEEDKTRVQAQLALLNGNEAVATSLTKKILMSQDATGALYQLWKNLPDARNPFEYLDKYLDMLGKKAAAILSLSPTAIGGYVGTTPLTNAQIAANLAVGATTADLEKTASPWLFGGQSAESTGPALSTNVTQMPSSTAGSWRRAEEASNLTGPIQVVVQIDGKAVASSMQNQSLSGTPTGVNRSSGMFGG